MTAWWSIIQQEESLSSFRLMAANSSLSAEILSSEIFNTMDAGSIETSGYNLLKEFGISPDRLTQGINAEELKMPDFFAGVMQRYFFSYMAALHLADHYFIEEVSRPEADYEKSKTQFLEMIQDLPEVLLKSFFERHEHAIGEIPCDLTSEQLFELGKTAFNQVITHNGHDLYTNDILEFVDTAFEKTKKDIAADVQKSLSLDEQNPAHLQAMTSLSENLQNFIENEEALSQEHVKAICDFLSGPYTVVKIPEQDRVKLEAQASLFYPVYQKEAKRTIPLIYRVMVEETFLPIKNQICQQNFCHYINKPAADHLKHFHSHLDNANRLVFALDQLRHRYELLNKDALKDSSGS